MYDFLASDDRGISGLQADRNIYSSSGDNAIHKENDIINRNHHPIATCGYEQNTQRGSGGGGGRRRLRSTEDFSLTSVTKKPRIDAEIDQHMVPLPGTLRPLMDLKETDVNTTRKAPPVRMTTAQYKLSNCHICGAQAG